MRSRQSAARIAESAKIDASIKSPAGGFCDGPWIGFLFLVPFVAMLVMHEFLGMSWAFLGGDTSRDIDSRGFNLMMFGTHFLGGLAFAL